MERMVAHLLEVHAGARPVWLTPRQVHVLPVVDDVVADAVALRDTLARAGIRATLNDRDATLGARVREAQQAKVPYIAVIGRQEVRGDCATAGTSNP